MLLLHTPSTVLLLHTPLRRRPLGADDKALLWRFRFALTSDPRALTKFLKVRLAAGRGRCKDGQGSFAVPPQGLVRAPRCMPCRYKHTWGLLPAGWPRPSPPRPQCVDWSDASEARQAAELMQQWAHIGVADALELLSPDFVNEEASPLRCGTLCCCHICAPWHCRAVLGASQRARL